MNIAKDFISSIMSAISNCALYSSAHISVDEFTRRTLMLLDKLFQESDSFEIMLVEDDLIINKMPFKGIGLQGSNFKKRLKRKGLSIIEFLQGVTFEELRQFIPEILETNKKMPAFPHIRTGVIDIQMEQSNFEDDFDYDDNFVSRQIEMVKEIYEDISNSKKLNTSRLNDVIRNFVSACRKKTVVSQLLGYAKSREEYTYIHATNVSILSIFQMATLGMREELFLRDVGISGLFHDIGKFFISGDVLGKKGILDDKEWDVIKLHPLYGARYLSSMAGIPHLATTVAFQHHLRYDGQGYPKLRTSSLKQHVCSQVVAIADVFDALRSTRPYRKSLGIIEILRLMKKESASAFNPFLLENFIRRMHKTTSQKSNELF